MNNLKWLKRKMPMNYERFMDFVDYDNMKNKYLFGVLNNTVDANGKKYNSGTHILFKRSNPINNENHPIIYVIAKCEKGFTQSGFHSFTVSDKDVYEIFR